MSTRIPRGVVVAAGAVMLAAGVTLVVLVGATPDAAPHPFAPSASTRAAPGSIESVREQVRQVPGNWPAWSELGALELERGRASGDPAAYAAAASTFETSLRLRPDGNDDALAGRAALSAARHDFALAERQARQALAVNSASPQALATLTDALTELGRYDEALASASRLDAQRPGVASFTRLAYQAELRGRTAAAITLMDRAATEAGTPAQVAFARSHEGLLRLGAGDVAGALTAWRAGTAVAPDDAGLALLGARLAWAQGQRELTASRYAELVARRPTPSNAVAQAEVLTALGRPRDAQAALDVARAGQQLARQAGIAPEAADVLLEADHGDARQAVALAEQVWRSSPSVGAADAYGWALHVAGRDREALAFADRGLGLGGRPAAMLARRGSIRAALGDRRGAVADLRAALAADPTFSVLHAPRAADLLRWLEVAS